MGGILKIIVELFGGTNKLHYICGTKANSMTTLKMTTQDLANRAHKGDKVFVNGSKKSYFQLRNMKGKTYTVSIEHEGLVSVLKTTNYQTK